LAELAEAEEVDEPTGVMVKVAGLTASALLQKKED